MQLNIKIILLLFIAFLLYFTFFHFPPDKNLDNYIFWATLHLYLHSISGIFFLVKDFGKKVIPFISLLSFYNLVSYGLPIFFIRIDKFEMNAVLHPDVLEITFWAFLVFYSTFFFFEKTVFKNWKPFNPMKELSKRMTFDILYFSLIAIYLINIFFNDLQISHLSSFCFYVFVGLNLNLILDHRRFYFGIVPFLLIFIYEIILRITSGLLSPLLSMFLFVSLFLSTKKNGYYLILVFLLPLTVFYYSFSKVKSSYRVMVWYGNKEYNTSEKLEVINQLTKVEGQKISDNYESDGKGNFLYRFSYPLAAFSLVYSQTPDRVPFWGGVTYLPLFTKFIPRVLMPEKPIEDLGIKFGDTYGIRGVGAEGTSINTPLFSEFYMNFGLIGIFFCSFLLALLYIFLDKFLNSLNVSSVSKIVNLTLLFPLIITESNFSLIFGNILLICIVVNFIFKFINDI